MTTENTSALIQLLTAKELGDSLNLSKRQIFRLNSCGKLPAPIRIGVGSGATSEQPMDGAAEDVRIYDRTLSPDEILTIYNSRGRDGIALGRVAQYLLNEGAPGVVASGAGVIKDSGPSGLDGTPANSPTWASGELTFRRKPLRRLGG